MDSMDYWQRVVDWDDRSAFEQIFRLHSYYLLAMVRNHSLNYLCRCRYRNEIDLNDVNMESLALHTTPESLMISSEILHRMNAAINDLPLGIAFRCLSLVVELSGLLYD